MRAALSLHASVIVGAPPTAHAAATQRPSLRGAAVVHTTTVSSSGETIASSQRRVTVNCAEPEGAVVHTTTVSSGGKTIASSQRRATANCAEPEGAVVHTTTVSSSGKTIAS